MLGVVSESHAGSHLEAAARGGETAGKDFYERRFSAPVVTHESDALAVEDVEGERRPHGLPVREIEGQING